MLVVIFGTTGELIKLAPILRRLDEAGERYLLLSTAQQASQIPTALRDFGLRPTDLDLTSGRRGGGDLEELADVGPWLAETIWRFVRHTRPLRAALRRAPTKPLVLVHGDTMTTVIGAAMGRVLGVPVAHVEAGLRSGDWRNPFPEELDRRVTSLLAQRHYAPGAWAAGNLARAGVKGTVVDTGGNTIRDALVMVTDELPDLVLPDEPFGLVSMHRFELLGQPGRLEEVIRRLHEASRATPLLFVDHAVTAAALTRHGLDGSFDDRLRRIPRQRYYHFISLLKRAEFLVTDSGGSQEECTALGMPCLVHRVTTERQDGLDGGPVSLTRGDITALDAFLRSPGAWRREPAGGPTAPSDVILEDLRAHGFVAGG